MDVGGGHHPDHEHAGRPWQCDNDGGDYAAERHGSDQRGLGDGRSGQLFLSLGSAAQTGAITVGGNATFNTLTTFAGAYAVAFTGTTTTVDVDANFLNTGITTLGDQDTDILTFTGGLGAASAGGVSAAGAIRTAGQQIDLGAVSLGANTTIDSSNNGGSATGAIINIASVTGATHDLAFNPDRSCDGCGERDGHRSAWPA